MADRSNTPPTVAQPIKKSFSFTTSAAHRRAAGNPTALKALSGIERRAAKLRQKALDLHAAFEDRWTAREAIRLWKRHLDRAGQHPAPGNAKPTVSPDEVMKIAARNIQARTTRRLARIDDIKTRMANSVVRNLGSPSLRASFSAVAPVETNQQNKQPKLRRRQ